MPTSSLNGARVAILEARMSQEMSELVKRLGGVACPAPAVREVRRVEEAPAFLDALASGRFAVVVMMTGVGVSTFLAEADRLGRLDATLAALEATTTVCRGPKPTAVLKRHGVPVRVSAVSPFTTAELLDAMAPLELVEKDVALVHYGERNVVLAEALVARGVRLTEVCLYEWAMPLDTAPLHDLVQAIVDRRVDAIAFTSQVQWRHLLQIATGRGQADAMLEALTTDIVVAAIGPVSAAALRASGVTPDVLPGHPKLGPMLNALADYFELLRSEPTSL